MADDIKVGIGLEVSGTKSVTAAAKALDQMERELAQLAIKQKQGIITEKQFNKGVQEANRRLLKKTGTLSQTTKRTWDYAKSLKGATIEQIRLAKASNQLGSIASATTQKFKRFSSVGLQQVGYQVQDFAVQVQGGTSAFVAFGQQGSQLVSILGPYGALAGAFLAIGTAFLNVWDKTRKAKDGLDEFRSAVKDLDESLPELEAELLAVQLGFEGVEEAAITATMASKAAELARLENQVSKLREQVRAAGPGPKGGPFEVVSDEQRQLNIALERMGVLKKELGVLDQKGNKQQMLNASLEAALALRGSEVQEQENLLENERRISRERHEWYQRVKGHMKDLQNETTVITAKSYEMASAIAQSADDAVQLAKAIDSGAISAEQLATTNIQNSVLAAARAAQELAKNLGFSLKTALAMAGMITGTPGRGLEEGSGYADPRSPNYDPNRAKLDRLRRTMTDGTLDRFMTFPKGTGGGTSGGGTKQLTEQEKMLEKLRKDLAATTEELNRREEARIETFSSIVENGLESLVTGAQSVEDAFKSMLQNILLEIWRQAVAEPIGTSVGTILGNLIPGLTLEANGDAFRNGRVTPFARGGIVNSPTVFPMANGMGLMGESGPEAIMPLRRGRNGRLGVEVNGGAANVTQVFNINGNGDRYILEKIQQAAPQIAEATKASLIKDRQRGGAMKQVFR